MNPRRNPYRRARRLPVGALGVSLPFRPLLPDRPRHELEYGEGEFLYLLALWCGGGHIINLGDGNSATYFALALKDHGMAGHVSSVDCYDHTSLRRMARERDEHGVADRITLYNERTSTAHAKLQPCNLLFIDADHSYKGVWHDTWAYSALCEGWMAFHDTNQPDTHKVLKELVHPTWERLFWVNRIQVFRRK